MPRTLLSCLFVSFVVTSASTADWPQFRGPTGDGHATSQNLPTTWDETTNVAWKAEIPGKGWSSPSLFQNRLYVTTAVPVGAENPDDQQSLRAMCLDATSGRTLWEAEIFRPDTKDVAIHTKNSHASPTPLVEGNRVFVYFGHYGAACLDLAGNILWKDTTHRYEPVHGNGGSPVLVQGLLIFNCDGGDNPFVVALNANTGQEKWRFDRTSDSKNKFSFSTPTVITAGGRQQLITPGSGVVNALEPATGREIWRVYYGDGYSVIPKPVYGHG